MAETQKTGPTADSQDQPALVGWGGAGVAAKASGSPAKMLEDAKIEETDLKEAVDAGPVTFEDTQAAAAAAGAASGDVTTTSDFEVLKYYDTEDNQFKYQSFTEDEYNDGSFDAYIENFQSTSESTIWISLEKIDGTLFEILYDNFQDLDLASLYGDNIEDQKEELKNQIFSLIPDFVSSAAQSELVYDFKFIKEK